MNEKQLYGINSYIPSDDNIVFQTIYKLVTLGVKNPKYIFVAINDSGGIGTKADIFGDDSEEKALFVKLLGNEFGLTSVI